MDPYAQSVNPAVRSHLDAQIAFLNELSQTMSRSLQQVFQLNMQIGQTLIEEASGTAQRMLTAEHPTEALSAAASQAQPATDRLRVYRQQLSQLAATTQVDLVRVTEQHVQQTSRTARALADDVTRAMVEDTEKNLRQQEEAVQDARDAFKQEAQRSTAGADGAAGKPGGPSGGQSGPANGTNGMKGAASQDNPKAQVPMR